MRIFGNLIFAIIARMLCGNHLKYYSVFLFSLMDEGFAIGFHECLRQNCGYKDSLAKIICPQSRCKLRAPQKDLTKAN